MLSGVILAGNSRWSGYTDASVRDMGLMEVHVARMRKICSEIIISTNEPRPFLETFGKQVRIVTDFYKGKGALGGIYTALSLAVHPYVWIVDGELPIVSTRAASLLLDEVMRGEWDAVLPAADPYVQPYHAIYKKDCAITARDILQRGGGSVKTLLEAIQYGVIREETFIRRGVRPENMQKLMKTPAY